MITAWMHVGPDQPAFLIKFNHTLPRIGETIYFGTGGPQAPRFRVANVSYPIACDVVPVEGVVYSKDFPHIWTEPIPAPK